MFALCRGAPQFPGQYLGLWVDFLTMMRIAEPGLAVMSSHDFKDQNVGLVVRKYV